MYIEVAGLLEDDLLGIVILYIHLPYIKTKYMYIYVYERLPPKPNKCLGHP